MSVGSLGSRVPDVRFLFSTSTSDLLIEGGFPCRLFICHLEMRVVWLEITQSLLSVHTLRHDSNCNKGTNVNNSVTSSIVSPLVRMVLNLHIETDSESQEYIFYHFRDLGLSPSITGYKNL